MEPDRGPSFAAVPIVGICAFSKDRHRGKWSPPRPSRRADRGPLSMDSKDLSVRWADALAALRAEHLARLHAFGARTAAAVIAVAATLFVGVALALDLLWDFSFDDSVLGW